MDFSNLSPWAIPLFIYFAKICEISLMSIRIIMISRGFRLVSMLIAMIESLVWISILSLIVTNLDNPINIASFVLGMGSGTLLGILLEKKLALGLVLIRVITQKPAHMLLEKLREIGFRVTAINGESNYGKVQILFAAVRRKNINQFASVVKYSNPNAFFTIEDIREASQIIAGSQNFKDIKSILNPAANNIPAFAQKKQNYKDHRNNGNKNNYRTKRKGPKNTNNKNYSNTNNSDTDAPTRSNNRRPSRRYYKKPGEDT